MRLKKIHVKNFRLLSDVELELEGLTTLVVGRNNSGKTSLYEILKRFLGEKSRGFAIEDFSTACYDQFCEALTAYQNSEDDVEIRSKLPSIELRLSFQYDPASPDFGALAPLIVDVDLGTDTAIAVLQFSLRDGRIEDLFQDAPAAIDDEEARQEFFRLLRERIPANYHARIWAEDPNDPTNTRELQSGQLASLLDTGFINAQRGLDGENSRETEALGGLLESLFMAAKEPNADPKDRELADALDTAIQGVQSEIDENVQDQLNDLLPSLKTFGFPALNDSKLLTETTLDVARLLSNFTRIRYAGHSGVALPESYNGLGVRNLILILMRIVGHYKRFRASAEAPGLQVIFIEEPEAHLHPQMQEVFIRQLEKLVSDLTGTGDDAVAWPVQFVVSTHSSHVANEAGFECIRYFLSTRSADDPSIRQAKVKDLRTGLSGTDQDARVFLHKYLTLTRCDLFFADKAILVEGMSERLMVPVMLKKLAEPDDEQAGPTSQYISLLEVGGAYAHIFLDLLEFLELKSLIITDIDATAQENGEGKYKACCVSEGERTSNATLRHWFDENPCQIESLTGKTADDKTKGGIRVAYQMSEHPSGACGRTFEDAFILANPEKFELAQTERTELEQEAQECAQQEKKSAFALEYAIGNTEWATPSYISEGLSWLVEGVDGNIVVQAAVNA